ncbi:MAG: hypothetical protein N4J56_003818 [Chroococcidiopsis sp. SAG 2025]|uniref:P-II family nitrogen regulator n=1 Tax=Chroococcidiopsis sp. SAG 2025 TaxID=171389 RepID=UPI002937132F|nr:P-II family nitrogen regulator [Chroococcidiopsis sp. SAG 2025]MDV2994164.1 hypothetical protein [Chroococcidiopsis sp. SAG 2025]
MKKIEAIVPTESFTLVKTALANTEIIDLTVSTVRNYNCQTKQVQGYQEYAPRYEPQLVEKQRFFLASYGIVMSAFATKQ